jgi:hypothetical protein
MSASRAMNISVFFDAALRWFTDQAVLLGLLAALEATAALLLAFTVVIRQRQRREIHDSDISKLKARLSALEASQYRTMMQSLNKPRNTDVGRGVAVGAPQRK